MSEIVKVTVWVVKTQFKIYGVYSPPNNNLNHDILNITNNMITVGDFNAKSKTWGYSYQTHLRKTVKKYLHNSSLTLLYDPGVSKTFIHYSGSTTNPYLVMVSTNIADQCKRIITGDPGSGHCMTQTSLKLKTPYPTPSKQVMWNFRKANWSDFSKQVDDLRGDTIVNDSPYTLVTELCVTMKKSAKSAIPRGKMHKNKPSCTNELTNQRNKRSSMKISRKV